MVEYILIVTVTVIIIATLVSKLYRPMDAFVQSLMGTYVQCLLETGQLPALGSVAEDSSDESSCKIEMFTPGEKSQAGSKNKDDKNKDDSDSDKISNSAKKKGSSADNEGGSSRSRNKAFAFDHSRQHGTRGVDGRGGASDLLAGGAKLVSSEYFGGRGGGYAGGYGHRSRYVAITGAMAEDIMKKKREAKRGKIAAPPADQGGGGGNSKKIALIAPERKAANLGEMDTSGFSIGEIVKIILIAGIILVLALLIGGQAVSLSKNWEKAE